MAFVRCGQAASDVNHNAYIGLFNNDTAGRFLRVFAIAFGHYEAGGTPGNIIGFVEQGLGGFIGSAKTGSFNPTPVILNANQPPGLGYGANTGPGNPDAQVIQFAGTNDDAIVMCPSYPLFVIPVNYGVWVQANHGNGVIWGTWWYQVSDQPR